MKNFKNIVLLELNQNFTTTDNICIMSNEKNNMRYKKILGAKILEEIGFYDEILEEVVDIILSGETETAKGLLEELGSCNKQIEQYQKETRMRASCSFYTAIIAMFCGFGFIFWGVYYILTSCDNLAAGSAIAAIGGTISAFIAKTFLGVHRLSLQQLERYFDKPVIDTYLLMAQCLANNLSDSPARQRAFKAIIKSLILLIRKRT